MAANRTTASFVYAAHLFKVQVEITTSTKQVIRDAFLEAFILSFTASLIKDTACIRSTLARRQFGEQAISFFRCEYGVMTRGQGGGTQLQIHPKERTNVEHVFPNSQTERGMAWGIAYRGKKETRSFRRDTGHGAWSADY